MHMRDVCNSILLPLKNQVRLLAGEYSALSKLVKKLLKGYKFFMLESRVEIISKLKDWEAREQ